MKIGIAGVGGIGSNVAVTLARNGIHHFKLVDFDWVEPGNLNRQYYFSDQVGRPKVAMLTYNLKRIRPNLAIEAEHLKLSPDNLRETFKDCDVVVDGLDDKVLKARLVETFSDGHPWVVAASGIAGTQLTEVGCRRMGRAQVVGDFNTDVSRHPAHGPKVILVAAVMSHIILREANLYESL